MGVVERDSDADDVWLLDERSPPSLNSGEGGGGGGGHGRSGGEVVVNEDGVGSGGVRAMSGAMRQQRAILFPGRPLSPRRVRQTDTRRRRRPHSLFPIFQDDMVGVG